MIWQIKTTELVVDRNILHQLNILQIETFYTILIKSFLFLVSVSFFST